MDKGDSMDNFDILYSYFFIFNVQLEKLSVLSTISVLSKLSTAIWKITDFIIETLFHINSNVIDIIQK